MPAGELSDCVAVADRASSDGAAEVPARGKGGVL